MIADVGGAVATDASPRADSLEAILPVLVLVALAVVAVRGAVARFGTAAVRARRGSRTWPWTTPIAYVVGLVAGAGLGVAIALETGGLWSLGLALGLGASVVGVPALELVTARLRARGRS